MAQELLDSIDRDRSLYAANEYQWIERQIAALRDGRLDDLDTVNLAQYLTEMNISARRGLRSAFVVLLHHMLKIRVQPQRHTVSWNASIVGAQDDIAADLTDNPGLQQFVLRLYTEAYGPAVRKAAAETRLPPSAFPPANPWRVDEALHYAPPEPPAAPLRPSRKPRP